MSDIAQTFLAKLKSSPFVMIGLENSHKHHEPLTAQIDEDKPNTLYFFVGKDNRIAGGGRAMAHFASKGHDFFACLDGDVTQDNDRAEIDKLWSPMIESWFPGGKDDPNLCLLRFDVDSAELWESDMSLTGRVKLLFGGKVDSDEIGHHEEVSALA